jgi:hypothetical protein
MGNVVNLNRFRKRKAKEERKKQAEVNRRLHGRTKAERARDELQKQKLAHAVDGARLDKSPGSKAREVEGDGDDDAPTG